MSTRSLILGVVAVGLVAATSGPPATAFTNDKLALMTFSERVQIPGNTLERGTYRFHLADPDSGRSVMQVLSADRKIVYAMFLTMHDYRAKATDEPAVSFMEAPAGVAPPVKTLFYPGELRGYQFVYGKGEPNLTPPPAIVQPAITYTAIPATEPRAVFSEPAPIVSEPVSEYTAAPAAEPALPATASPLPLVALGGLVSLLAGLGLRRSRN